MSTSYSTLPVRFTLQEQIFCCDAGMLAYLGRTKSCQMKWIQTVHLTIYRHCFFKLLVTACVILFGISSYPPPFTAERLFVAGVNSPPGHACCRYLEASLRDIWKGESGEAQKYVRHVVNSILSELKRGHIYK